MIRRTTWVLLAVFAVLALATLYLQRTGRLTLTVSATPSPTPEEPPLLQVQPGGISRLTIQDAQGKVVSLQLEAASGWVMKEPKAGPADANRVEAAVTPLETLQVINKLQPAPAPGVVGLDKPSYSLSLGTKDGKQYTLQIGIAAPTGSGYYASLDGSQAVVVSKGTIDSLIDLLSNPPFPPTPTPEGNGTPGAGVAGTPAGLETPVPGGTLAATSTIGASGTAAGTKASQTPEGTGVPAAAGTPTP